jgi:hypothetical protein
MKLKYVIALSIGTSAVLLFSAFGGEKMTQAEQLKNIDAMVAEKVASFEARKKEECKAMALQKAIGMAEEKMAAETKGKPTVAAPKTTKKGGTAKTKPAPAPKVTPAPAPTPSNPKKDKMNTGNSGAVSPEATQAKKDKMGGAADRNDGAVSPEATQAKKNKMKGGGGQ